MLPEGNVTILMAWHPPRGLASLLSPLLNTSLPSAYHPEALPLRHLIDGEYLRQFR